MDDLRPTLKLVERGLMAGGKPYVAFSGGKDSLVVSHLVRTVAPDTEHIYSDDELLFDEHVQYVERMRDYMPLRVVQGGSVHAGWFRPWTDEPYWREISDYMELIASGFDDRMHPHLWGYKTAFRGLRAQESRGRAERLADTDGVGTRGGMSVIDPIHDWTVEDVWEYIHLHDLPYCSVYDRMTEIGIAIRHQRLGPLPLAKGDILLRGWPSLYRDVTRRYGIHWSHSQGHLRQLRRTNPLIELDIREALTP